jgi:uncharacterized protein (TIGR03790 family)
MTPSSAKSSEPGAPFPVKSLLMNLIKVLVFWLVAAPAAAWAGGDEVVVLYNTRVPESKMVADHYAAARGVPAGQIFGFALTTNEVITRADFTDFLQKPLAEDLEAAGLWKFGEAKIAAAGNAPAHSEERVVTTKIRYAVLCYGMPLKIAASDSLEMLAGKAAAKPEFRRDEAAVDSELAWLPLIRMNVPLIGPLPNLLYCCTNQTLLSPLNGVLLVARLDGPTPEIANGLVDKALAGERDGLWGRAYFDLRGVKTNDGYYMGDLWLRTGAEICRQLGYDVEIDTNPETFPESYPMSQIAIYAGWYDADVSGPFRLPKVEFMPGAFAYHLHSFSADTLRSADARWCGPLLAKGATCTMGCVYEPYLQFTPNIAFFLQSLGNGYTFGEAAWASQLALSWQTTVIGDPLYRPFGKTAADRHAALARAHNPLLQWSFESMVNLDIAHGARAPQAAEFLENLPATATSAVLTEKLATIYDELGKPSSAIETWQKALKLNPSPQQRIRIRRILEEKLLADGRKAEAVENDKSLLAEAPDYPGKAQIEEKIKALERADPGANPPPK